MFKVGDRVRTVCYGLGVITEVTAHGHHYVKFDSYRDSAGHDWSIFARDCLELVDPTKAIVACRVVA
jgi:hypothetical protein